jgi:protein-disulfide isomerase
MDPEHIPAPPQGPAPEPPPAAATERLPRFALFAAGALTGAVAMLLVLAVAGVLGGRETGGTASTSTTPLPSAGSSSAAAGTSGALVTPPPVVAPPSFTPTALAEGHALGSADAPVTVEVWADYQCPYCARFSAQIEPQIISTYVTTGKVRFVFRDLAFLGDESRWAAVAARLAEQQGMFWPYHDYLFANQLGENVGSFDVARLEEIASKVGLDRSAFDAGLQLDAARTLFSEIQDDSQTDATRLGISATPTVVVDGTKLTGNDWNTIRTAIEAALAG